MTFRTSPADAGSTAQLCEGTGCLGPRGLQFHRSGCRNNRCRLSEARRSTRGYQTWLRRSRIRKH